MPCFPVTSEQCNSSDKALGNELNGPGSFPSDGGVEIFLHFIVSRLVLGSTQPPVKWVPGVKAVERRISHPTFS